MPRARLSVCALLSGGLDSSLLFSQLLQDGWRPMPVYVRCGLRWEETELFWLRRFLRAIRPGAQASLQVIQMPLGDVYARHWSLSGRHTPDAKSSDAAVFLPGRNVLLATVAAIVCAERRISDIALGTLKGNPFHDASRRFLTQLAGCLTHALDHPIRIVTPLARSSKAQLIRTAAGVNGSRGRSVPLQLTFSCLKPRKHRHCGRCNKCAERQRAFDRAGVFDPTAYVSRSA